MVQDDGSQITILATVVLYNGTLESSDTWQTLQIGTPSYVSWLIINNGPSSIILPPDFRGEYFEDLSNSGLAVAYKKALVYAQERAFSHLLFLDQDTTFPADFWGLQKKCIKRNAMMALYLPTVYGARYMISPCRMKRGSGKAVTVKELPEKLLFQNYSFINSGALFSVKDLVEVWDDSITDLFLDNVDHAIAYYLGVYKKEALWFAADIEQSFSGDSTNREQILRRFKGWIKDALVFGKISKTSLWQKYTIVRRRIRYFLRFRDWRFLQ